MRNRNTEALARQKADKYIAANGGRPDDGLDAMVQSMLRIREQERERRARREEARRIHREMRRHFRDSAPPSPRLPRNWSYSDPGFAGPPKRTFRSEYLDPWFIVFVGSACMTLYMTTYAIWWHIVN